jgi:hypothetical protein
MAVAGDTVYKWNKLFRLLHSLPSTARTNHHAATVVACIIAATIIIVICDPTSAEIHQSLSELRGSAVYHCL